MFYGFNVTVNNWPILEKSMCEVTHNGEIYVLDAQKAIDAGLLKKKHILITNINPGDVYYSHARDQEYIVVRNDNLYMLMLPEELKGFIVGGICGSKDKAVIIEQLNLRNCVFIGNIIKEYARLLNGFTYKE